VPLNARKDHVPPPPIRPKGGTWLGAACALIIVVAWSNSGHSGSSNAALPDASTATENAPEQTSLPQVQDDSDQSLASDGLTSSAEDSDADDSDQESSALAAGDDQADSTDVDDEVGSYASSGTCDEDYYEASSGHCVHRPVAAASAPDGASAQCRDGTYSFSEHHRGTCSHHGGVDHWL
jgi:hypothetical protein